VTGFAASAQLFEASFLLDKGKETAPEMPIRLSCVGLLTSCMVVSTIVDSQTKETPLAVNLVNLSIDLAQIGRNCHWDESQGHLSLDRPLLWSSAVLRGAIADNTLTLKEATATQALMIHRGYVDERAAATNPANSDCRQWQTLWVEMSADLKSLKPLYLDLPSEDDRQQYFSANATSCFQFAIHELDDGHSDAQTIARSVFPYCRESIPAGLFTDEASQAKLAQTLATRVLVLRAEKRNAH
jgi:hypothetical protein